MSLIALSLALVAISGFNSPSHLGLPSALADIEKARQQRTVAEHPYQLKIKWSRGRLAGEMCGGFKNWRCASGLYCERQRDTFGVCVGKKKT